LLSFPLGIRFSNHNPVISTEAQRSGETRFAPLPFLLSFPLGIRFSNHNSVISTEAQRSGETRFMPLPLLLSFPLGICFSNQQLCHLDRSGETRFMPLPFLLSFPLGICFCFCFLPLTLAYPCLTMTPQRLALSLLATAALSLSMRAQTPSSLEGIWLGKLDVGPGLRLQLHLHQQSPGVWTCAVDSLDQNATGIPCKLTSATNPIKFEIPAVRASFTGTLTADAIAGTFTQGGDLPLTLTRQATAITAQAPKPPDMLPALPPADSKTIKAILDKDLAAQLKSGDLSATGAGITIGILSHGDRAIFSYGVAKSDSVFEIGSVTKTFTGLLLAQQVEQKIVRLDEPVRELLPEGTVAKPATGHEITLLDLSDQHSGLPRMPDNFHPADPANPYADYTPALLYAFIAKQGVAHPDDTPFGYSNLGVGLLGAALASHANKSYGSLLHEEILGPLGMNETGIALSSSMRDRVLPGYDAQHHPAHAWDLDALAGAGGLRSTAADMLLYLDAQLHPDEIVSPSTHSDARTLPAAIAASHVLHAEVDPGMHIALNWFHIDATGSFWHNGGTGGYTSFALFNPAQDFALIVLSNTGPGPSSFTDKLGTHIAQRLSGKPAISLVP
jgi:D-alanyl-D-alanine-carboxypeptidase/D-alanyl-D-alanine-endopeptidase